MTNYVRQYKLYTTSFDINSVTTINEDGSTTSFTFDPANTDYQAYLKWLDEGNTPLPAEENN